MRLHKAVALVTGAASGLGLATARRLHRSGAAVVLADLPSTNGKQAVGEFKERAVFISADVTSEQEVDGALELAAGLGPLRVVVNCAGVVSGARLVGRDGPFPLATFARTVQVNLIGTFNVIRLAAARMAANEPVDGDRGVIVNTASVAAFDGQIGQAAYSASKAGVVGLTLPAARELAAHQIRVVTIAPGLFETPMLAGLPPQARRSLGSQVPHPSRLGRPEEFAALVQHVVDNPMLNGETIRLDGAIRMAAR